MNGNVNGDWRRISVSFTTLNVTISIGQILLGFKNAHGTIYFDGIQLEVGGVANPYNMFENGGMNRIDSSGNIESWLCYY